jgi:magnesium transporter
MTEPVAASSARGGAPDNDPTPLSLAFMREHPAQAARVLDALPAADAAALFERMPARVGAAVLAAMLPHRAALCTVVLDDSRVQELLATLGTQPTVALLRQMPEVRRQQLVAGLPTATAMASTLLLGYAEDSLGAWADPDVVMLPAETRVAAALDRARGSALAHPGIFVADATRRLAGIVDLAALLAAPPAASLATLMRRPVAVLAAHGSLAGAPAHPGWAQASTLPVVEPGEKLVGVLTHDALVRALQRNAPDAADNSGELAQWPQLLALGYWQALAGLMDLGLRVLPGVPPVVRPNDAATSSAGQTP